MKKLKKKKKWRKVQSAVVEHERGPLDLTNSQESNYELDLFQRNSRFSINKH